MNAKPTTHAPVPDSRPDQSLQTRWSLIERLKDWEDEVSWRVFFNTYWGLIYGVALKSGLTEVEAQEAVQETVIAVAKKMPEFKCDPAAGSFKGFLLQITRRRIVDQFRKRQAGPAPNISVEASATFRKPTDTNRTATIERVPDPAGFDLERVWNAEWEKHLMDAALAGVKRKADPEQFQMFELHVLRQMPAREVARKLGVNAAQVYFAKYKIAGLLKKEGKRLEAGG